MPQPTFRATASRQEPGPQAKSRGRDDADLDPRSGSCTFPTSTLPFEPEKLDELFAFVAKGLVWHHWGVLITLDTAGVWAGILHGPGERLLTSQMAQARVRCTGDPGGGTFNYEGVQASDNYDDLDVLRLRRGPVERRSWCAA